MEYVLKHANGRRIRIYCGWNQWVRIHVSQINFTTSKTKKKFLNQSQKRLNLCTWLKVKRNLNCSMKIKQPKTANQASAVVHKMVYPIHLGSKSIRKNISRKYKNVNVIWIQQRAKSNVVKILWSLSLRKLSTSFKKVKWLQIY